MSDLDPKTPSIIWQAALPWFAKRDRWRLPIGELGDMVVQAAVDALRLRYPLVTPDDRSLSLLGRDRRIPRAPGETAESYARRLALWLDLWALAGLPLGLLYALQSFVFPGYPTVRIVERTGLWHTLDAGASATLTPYEAMTLPCAPLPDGRANPLRYVPALEATPRALYWMHQASPNNWDWDSISAPGSSGNWWEFWVIVYPPSWPFGGTYAGTGANEVVYGSGNARGFDEIAGTFDVFRELVRIYRRAGAKCKGAIFAPTLADFDPYTPAGDPGLPDGYWSADAKISAGASTHTRRRDCRYLLRFPPE